MAKKVRKLWEGRFTQTTDPHVDRFCESLSEDACLLPYDIAGSIAHAHALARAGLLTPTEQKKIISGLKVLAKEDIPPGAPDEDVHMYVERRLTEKIGSIGGKLHTGRSRNDQVALDLRLYLRAEGNTILDQIVSLQKEIVRKAERHIGVLLPGYTHLQRAQPVLLSHHLLAYYEMLERDRTRVSDGLRRSDQMPLGSGALAGNSFALDRNGEAKELGFGNVTENSMDAVSDRDFVIEFLSASSILLMHLSRWAEEWILWNSSEYGFIQLPDKFCTGSSMMPQKKNPDVLELIRGKTGRVFGALIGMLTLVKGLPLTYNRDLQEDKRFLFDTVNTVKAVLTVMISLVAEVQFVVKKMELAASDPLLLATDLSDYLVRKGAPFRTTHKIVGQMVAESEHSGKPIPQWSLSALKKHSPLFEEDLFSVLSSRASVEKKRGVGGTSPQSVKEQIERIQKRWSNG